jgi:surface protein
MKTILLSVALLFIFVTSHATQFITRWDLSKPGTNDSTIIFGVGTTGLVNYTWETVPSGTSGAGSFTGNTATIKGLPPLSIIRLKIDSANFNKFAIGYNDQLRLLDVEQWGTIQWSTMEYAYPGCFNLNITSIDIPDLSQVTNMNYMFTMDGVSSVFNSPNNINSWNTSNVTNMNSTFAGANSFNQPINNWNTSNVTDMSAMFYNAKVFNQPLNNWDVRKVIDMSAMFANTDSFNQPLNNWMIDSLTFMDIMFSKSLSFNQNINIWNTEHVKNMSGTFSNTTSFNQPLNNWNTKNVIMMREMFLNAKLFNQPLDNWNVEKVKVMYFMFSEAALFNQPLNNWNIKSVINMNGMFYKTKLFNQALNNWDVDSVDEMMYMFYNASSFNQSLSNWQLPDSIKVDAMLDSCGMDCSNYTATLKGWGNNPNIGSNLILGADNLSYGLNAVAERNYLNITKGWSLVGDIAGNSTCNKPTIISNSNKQSINFSIAPNPTYQQITITNPSNFTNASLYIYSSTGQLLFSQKNINTSQLNLDVSHFANGIYFVEMKDKGGKKIVKMVKE